MRNEGKVFDARSGITKAEIAQYYAWVAPMLLPHISGKPFTMIHFPDGVGGKSFYQLQIPQGAPDYLDWHDVPSGGKRDVIRRCVVNNVQSVLYMVSRGVVEMHTWFSRLPRLELADVAVIDLDPSGATGFDEARVLACAFRLILERLKLFAVPKTSGGRGIHIYIPIEPAPFEQVRDFLNSICRVVENSYPDLATQERIVAKRGDRVYLDAVQNASGKTIAAPYSLRCREGFPVSAPLLWEELDDPTLLPQRFTLRSMPERIAAVGDLMQELYSRRQTVANLLH